MYQLCSQEFFSKFWPQCFYLSGLSDLGRFQFYNKVTTRSDKLIRKKRPLSTGLYKYYSRKVLTNSRAWDAGRREALGHILSPRAWGVKSPKTYEAEEDSSEENQGTVPTGEYSQCQEGYKRSFHLYCHYRLLN